MKNVNHNKIQSACSDERVPAGHAISKNSVPDSKTECLGYAGTLLVRACTFLMRKLVKYAYMLFSRKNRKEGVVRFIQVELHE